MAYVALACRWAICGVFLAAALSKCRSRSSRAAFLSSLAALAPGVKAAPLGVLVIVVELAVALLVTLPATAAVGLGLAGAALVAFSVAIGSGLRRGVTVACRCFGWSAAPVSRVHLVRNGVLLAIVLAGALTARAAGAAAPHAAGLALSLAAALVVVVLILSSDDLAWVFSRSSSSRHT